MLCFHLFRLGEACSHLVIFFVIFLFRRTAEVKSMPRVGVNRYFWPRLEDVIWYQWDNLIMSISESKHVTARHVQIDPEEWKCITKAVDKRSP